MSIHKWLNWPKRNASTLSPGDRVLAREISQPAVPVAGRMKHWPCSVRKTFFKSCSSGVTSWGNTGLRWSTICACMALRTESGTVVGPGTNK